LEVGCPGTHKESRHHSTTSGSTLSPLCEADDDDNLRKRSVGWGITKGGWSLKFDSYRIEVPARFDSLCLTPKIQTWRGSPLGYGRFLRPRCGPTFNLRWDCVSQLSTLRHARSYEFGHCSFLTFWQGIEITDLLDSFYPKVSVLWDVVLHRTNCGLLSFV
jgi:hypothetical protein